MRVVVNALSTTNLSGRHVLFGHLARVARWSAIPAIATCAATWAPM